MIEFIQLMGIKRILFLAGLILYVAVILIIVCLPEKKKSSRDQEYLAHSANELAKNNTLEPEDAYYSTSNEATGPLSPKLDPTSIFHRFFRKKSQHMDPWES